MLASATELHPLATEVETGAAVDLYREITDARTLRLALRGSAALPLLAGPPVELGGRRLIDAGLSAAIPFRAALADGATHVLVLRSRAGEVATAPGRVGETLTGRALRASRPRSERGSSPAPSARARTRRCSPATTPIPLWRPRSCRSARPPGSPVPSRLEHDIDVIRGGLEAGRVAVLRALDAGL